MSNNLEVMAFIWNLKKKGISYPNTQILCNKIAENLLKFSMNKLSSDNVSTIFIAFQNFENSMRNINFISNISNRCEVIPESFDLYEIDSI